MASYRGHLTFAGLLGAAAAVAPILLFDRVKELCQQSTEETLAVLVVLYLFIRYVLSFIFKTFTVHRGMFHSVPAFLIAGLMTYLLYPSDDVRQRLFVSGAVMIGFLSHLVLDEIYSVDFMGARLHLNKYAGSALKFFSKSWPATLMTYLLLGLLTWHALLVGR